MDQQQILEKRTITSSLLNLNLRSDITQVINIRITAPVKNFKISVWEELTPGLNKVDIDLTILPKGIYDVVVTMSTGKIHTESFTKY